MSSQQARDRNDKLDRIDTPAAIGRPGHVGRLEVLPERMNESLVLCRLLENVFLAIEAEATYLSALDQAIGDGDHGSNMLRGFIVLRQASYIIPSLDFSDACRLIGSTLLMNIGGASGPLYGSLFIAFGNAPGQYPATTEAAAAMLRLGVEAVKSRGRSDVGAKTMLDVLIPLVLALEADKLDSLESVCALVRGAADDTRHIIATKGRAAYLGTRSLGHVDPGAASAAIIVTSICQTLMEKI